MQTSSWPVALVAPRARVISDNDYGGDPDGLVQLVHHALSPAVDLRVVIGSHLKVGDPWNTSADSASRAAAKASDALARSGRSDVRVVTGVDAALVDRTTPIRSDAALAIVEEAMRDDPLPLFVVCGAGLTEIASAWLIEPRIASRLTLVWIGGREHDGYGEVPPGATDMEYNLNIDPVAGQVVFNDSDLAIWQVPRNMYRTVIASRSEMLVRMRAAGVLGAYLFDELADVVELVGTKHGFSAGECYVLGDSPLVLLTALWTSFEPGPASSFHVTMPCPRILDSGRYELRPDGRPLRLYRYIDNRLLLEDLYAKLLLHQQEHG